MRRAFLILISLLGALVIQWIASDWMGAQGISWPVFAGAVLFWFWRLKPAARLWLGIGAGVVLDSLSLNHFGVYSSILAVLALATSGLQSIFTNIQSPLVQGIGMAILLILFLGAGVLINSL